MNKIELLDKDENVVLTIFENCKVKSSNSLLKKAIGTFITNEKSRIETDYDDDILLSNLVTYQKGSATYFNMLYDEIFQSLAIKSKKPKAYIRMVADDE